MFAAINFYQAGASLTAPVNTVAPAVTGTATFGQVLTTTNGTWTGSPTSYAYQWYRSPSTSIGGATSSTYTLVAGDIGNTIYCKVTATNAAGSTVANSNTTSTVVAAVPGAPTIGTATATGSTTATVAYTAPASNGGATITSYTAVSVPGGITGTLSTSTSGTITVSGLTAATSYYFTVYATNSAGNSASSAGSNTITTTATYYLATFSLANGNRTGAQGSLGYDSVNTNIWLGQTLTSATTIAWSKLSASTFAVGYTAAPNSFSCLFSPYFINPKLQSTTGNMIGFGYPPGAGDAHVISYTSGSSPSINWALKVLMNLNFSALTTAHFPSLVPRSDGSILLFGYIQGNQTTCCCCVPTCNFVAVPAIGVINAAGTTWSDFAHGDQYSYGVGNWGIYQGGAVATSGNVYAAGGRDKSSTGTGGIILHKFNSTGTNQWKKFISYTASPFYSYLSDFAGTNMVTDSSENIYFSSVGTGGTAFIYKFDSSGAIVWAKQYTAVGGTASNGAVRLDNGENPYFYFGGGGAIFILKFNSSGTIQWQRKWTASGSYASNVEPKYFGLDFAGDGSLLISWSGATSGNYGTPTVAKLPTDGSKTGVYSNQGVNLTYAAATGTITDRSSAFTVANDTITFGGTVNATGGSSGPGGTTTLSLTQYLNTL